MAARKVVKKSTITCLKSLLNPRQKCSSPSLQSSHLGGFASPAPSFRHRLFTSRIPVELSGGIESLMPFHSVTASALLTCMLSSKVGQWATLSEGLSASHSTSQPESKSLSSGLSIKRLRDLKQLGATHMVYPGAMHSRFEHSLGVYWLPGEAVHKLKAHQGRELDIDNLDVLDRN